MPIYAALCSAPLPGPVSYTHLDVYKRQIHIHVDAANHNRQSLKNLIGIMYSKEDILFKALQVNESRASRWCQKVREPMLQKARKLSSEETKNLTQLEAIWYEGDNGSTEHYNWTRYYACLLYTSRCV